MVADAAGAVAVFALVGLFYRLQRDGDEQPAERTPELFAASKEAVALVVLLIFLVLAGNGVSDALLRHEGAGVRDQPAEEVRKEPTGGERRGASRTAPHHGPARRSGHRKGDIKVVIDFRC